jgi:predicted transcriptional regulator
MLADTYEEPAMANFNNSPNEENIVPAFAQETLDAWDEYQATGMHVTDRELIIWLQSWGTANEMPPPVCHT